MLFNSNEFILLFLPLAVAGFFGLQRVAGPRAGIVWLALASVGFYAYWRFENVFVLLVSIAVNFFLGRLIAERRPRGALVAGIGFNLLLLGYFKYVNFFLDQWNVLFGESHHVASLVLPIGISFFTFQQIAFLIDSYQGKGEPARVFDYVLFVCFFPQLIAGPIVHHREMMPQFADARTRRFDALNVSIGLTIFAIGLFKKVIVADGIATYVRPVFDGQDIGVGPEFFAAWGATFAYTFQIYFDFSGYSDMAIGLGRMFNIRLPFNFDSPYKASSIIEFWRRWHMTLSRFLRDYLYYPLGGNRKGVLRRYGNLMFVMVLGGLWHGAGWTFVLWGALHGFYLLVNHSWRFLRGPREVGRLGAWAGRAVTFVAVAVAWVLFRADSVDTAWAVYGGMLGLNGATVPVVVAPVVDAIRSVYPNVPLHSAQTGGYNFVTMFAGLVACALATQVVPDTTDLVRAYDARLDRAPLTGRFARRVLWPDNAVTAAVVGFVMFLVFRTMNSGGVSEFIYFQF